MVLAVAAGGCGGKAVVDGTSSGGAAGAAGSGTTSSTTTSPGSGGSGGTANRCATLETALEQALAEALACSPMLSVEQCTGELIVLDTCGCELAANVFRSAEVGAAEEAYSEWVNAGCGPYDCTYCPPTLPAYCEPTSPSGETGLCVPLAN